MILKVHKNENFFGFDFEFCTVSLLVMLKYEGFVKIILYWAIMVGGRIIPRRLKTTGNLVKLSLRLSRIEFSLVSDYAESDSISMSKIGFCLV